MAFNATISAVDANSYIDVATADAYHAERLHNDAWIAAIEANKEKALMWATKLLDNISYLGFKATAQQSLNWPRQAVTTIDGLCYLKSDTIPAQIKDACAELAFVLLTEDTTKTPDTAGLNKIKMGSLEVGIDSTTQKPIIPKYVINIITQLLAVGSPTGISGRIVRV